MIRIPFGPRYAENRDRRGDATPCIVCGKAVTNPRFMVHVHNGGGHVVTEEEAATLSEAADLGWYPLGRDCWRKHPELQPYAYRITDSSDYDPGDDDAYLSYVGLHA